jgi:polyhydroxybutyrate depolymerase
VVAAFVLLVLAASGANVRARQEQPQTSASQSFSIVVDGVTRTGVLFTPQGMPANAPLVLVFHGHGGTAEHMARTFQVHRSWPEAVVLYLQGLPAPGLLVDPEGRFPGWQSSQGAQDDRDLKLFDAALARVFADTKADAKRVFVTGHSNGGVFTYLLWAARGEKVAAVAPSAASAGPLLASLKPKPFMQIAGEADALVRFAWQRQTMDGLRRLNGCAAEGTAWAPLVTLYASKTGTPCLEYIHPGGHVLPREAPALVAKFFKERPAGH